MGSQRSVTLAATAAEVVSKIKKETKDGNDKGNFIERLFFVHERGQFS